MSEPTVLVSGVFDPLHAGHVAYLNAARKYGPLLCALSDNLQKHQPLVPLADREIVLRALGVEEVVGGEVADVIKARRPQFYVKGQDWIGRLPGEQITACEAVGTKIVYTDTAHASSSGLLSACRSRVDCDAVERFERLVAQQVDPVPWVPVTDYSLEGRRAAEGRHPRLIRESFQPERVLDVGCGPGHLMTMLREVGVSCEGLDCSPEAHAIGAWPESIANPDLPLRRKFRGEGVHRYDLVICREVLEHLTIKGIRQAVRNLVRLSSKYIYITTRFHESPSHLLDVQTSDDLDPTHITMLTKPFLRALFVLEGCRSRPDLEEKMDWQHKGRCLVFDVA